MADKEYEDDDPMELVGMVMPGMGDEGLEMMGRVFIDEYLRMGWPPGEIAKLFRDPFYRAPHAVYRRWGDAHVWQLIERVMNEGTA